MEVLFWVCLSLLFYSFLGYPLVLKLLSLLRGEKSIATTGDYLPTVSIVLSVFNEEDVIEEKIDNFIAIDYPDEKLEMVVISDMCADRTEELIRAKNCDRVKLFRQEKRRGKTLNLNRGVAESRGEVVVFTDANSMFDGDAINRLVQPLSDERIGLVSGRSIYLASGNQHEEIGGAYRAYEEMLKALESRIGSIVGADGAIYALRKELYEPLKSEYINDFVHTGHVVIKGYRAVSEPQAVCKEVVDATHKDELGRQTRMMAQSWLVYFAQIGPLLRNGCFTYAWEITSHKLLRWLTLPLMVTLGLTNLFLVKLGEPYLAFFVAQVLFWAAVLLGQRTKEGVVRVPYMFFMIHYAAVLGFFKFASGNVYATWSPRND